MKTRTFLVLLCVAAIPSAVYAQSADDDDKWVGAITGENVYIRAMPGMETDAVCDKVQKGTRVTVVGRHEVQGGTDWLKIQPTSGCYSAVHSRYIKPDSDGEVGTVDVSEKSYLNVRAAGKLCKKRFSYVQRPRLLKGDKVRILDKAGQYYLIVPPEGAYWFVSADYVEKAPERVEANPDPDDPEDSSVGVDQTDPNDGVIETEETEEEVAEVVKAWKDAEKALFAEFKKSYKQRDLKSVLATYESLKLSEDSYLEPYVKARVAFLKAEMERYEKLQEIEKLVQKTEEEQEKLKLLRTKLETSAPESQPVTGYATSGVLKASDLFRGGATGPKRYMVLDPKGRRIKAYVQSPDDLVDLSKYEGKLVGVYGPRKFDAKLSGLFIVNAERVVVIEEDVKLPDRPKAKVKRGQMPAPKIETTDDATDESADTDDEEEAQRPSFPVDDGTSDEQGKQSDQQAGADSEISLPIVEGKAERVVDESEYE